MSNQNTMLIGMTFKMPRQVRKLPSVASGIEEQANADKDTVTASIRYFRSKQGKVKKDGLATLKNFQVDWKDSLSHFARYPFAAGFKILPASLVEEAMKVNESFQAREAGIRDAWLKDEYPLWLESAPIRMGSLYDPVDFPSAQDCMNRFKCEVVIVPLAEAEQWQRISVLAPNIAASMQSAQNAAVDRATKQAHSKLWVDIMGLLGNVVSVLDKDKTKIHESLLGNLIAIADLVPAYNQIHQDPSLTAIAAKIKEGLSSITLEDLRGSAETKAKALEKAKELVAEYEPYTRSFVETDEEESAEDNNGKE